MNLEVEQELLGALLSHPDVAADLIAPHGIRADDFADSRHARIYTAIMRAIEAGQQPRLPVLKQQFERDETLKEIGGTAYLARLAASATTIRNVGDYAELIRDLAVRRALIDATDAAQEEARGSIGERKAEDVVADLSAALDAALDHHAAYEAPELPAITGGLLKQIEAARRGDPAAAGLATGLIDLDKKTGGLHPTDLVILAGRPGMGKSGAATTIAQNAARRGEAVAFFSLEMSADQLGLRFLARDVGASVETLRSGAQGLPMDMIVQASAEIGHLPIAIRDKGGVNLSYIRREARRIKRRLGKLSLIVVDYLQIMSADFGRRDRGRVVELAEITGGLKALAKELRVPILLLSQLNRAAEGREDKRPQLADLRESGAIEQDADLVLFVYREEYYVDRQQPSEDADPFKFADWLAEKQRVQGRAQIIIGKQRHGATGVVDLIFNGPQIAFENAFPGRG